MKKNFEMTRLFRFCTIIICLSFSFFSNAQSSFTIDSLKQVYLHQSQPVNIYVSAMWCLPCVKKLKHVSDSLKNFPLSREHNYVLFDRLSFSKEKLARLDLSGFDSLKIFLVPTKYYSKKFIQINPSRKVLAKYIADLRNNFKIRANGIDFWYGDMFTILANGDIEFNKITVDQTRAELSLSKLKIADNIQFESEPL